jgi:hypothetical protein
VDVHRATASWGEGASNAGSPGGQGAIAAANDATWLYRFFESELWSSPGGDFAATPTVSFTPSNFGSISITGLNADVQSWLDGQAVNNGWLIKLATEGVPQTAIRFDSKDNAAPTLQPRLILNFRGGGDANGDDLVDIGDFATLAANFNQPLFGPDNGDFDRTNLVDIGDFAILAGNFNQNFAARAVPEITTPGDASGDNAVDIGDFAILASNFNHAGGYNQGNFNFDALVDIGDFALLAANFNRTLGTDLPRGAAVPEPVFALAPLALGFIGSRRN